MRPQCDLLESLDTNLKLMGTQHCEWDRTQICLELVYQCFGTPLWVPSDPLPSRAFVVPGQAVRMRIGRRHSGKVTSGKGGNPSDAKRGF